MRVLATLVTLSIAFGPIVARQSLNEPGCYDGRISAEECCIGVSDFWVHLPDPQDCTKFYQCDNGKAVHKDCPASLHWSIEADRCEWPYNAGCTGNPRPPTPNSTLKPNPSEVPTEPAPTTSRPSSTTTSRPSSTTTLKPSTHRPSSTPGPTNPPQNNGSKLPEGCYDGRISAEDCCVGISDHWVHLPDPQDCGKFYQCDNGKAVHKDCPGGLHWSIAADRCEWPENAGCANNPSRPPTSSSTLKPNPSEVPAEPSPSTTSRPSPTTTLRPSTHRPSPTPEPTNPPNNGSKLPEGCYDGNISAEDCCDGVSDHWVHLPDPQDCGKFYQCDNGKAVHKDCPGDLHWSVASDRCEWPEIAGCINNPSKPPTSSSTTKPNPTDTTTSRPDTTSAPETTTSTPETTSRPDTTTSRPNTTSRPDTTTIESSSSVPSSTTTSAPPSTLIPPQENNCEPPPVCHQCLTGVFPANLCCKNVKNWQKIHLANATNCSSYIDCVDGKAVPRKCPLGLHWSVETDRCDYPEIAKCSTNSTTPPPGNGSSGNNNDGNGENGNEGNGENGNGENGENSNEGNGENSNGENSNEGNNEENNGSGENSVNSSEEIEVSKRCLFGMENPKRCCKGVPETVDVLLQNNNNCNTYIQCVHGKPLVRPCPSGLKWSAIATRCEWPSLATCPLGSLNMNL